MWLTKYCYFCAEMNAYTENVGTSDAASSTFIQTMQQIFIVGAYMMQYASVSVTLSVLSRVIELMRTVTKR